MQSIPRVTVRELAHKIKGHGFPRFAFLLGAGASKQSGIPHVNEMVRYFKEQIIARSCPDELETDEEKMNWLEAQEWYQADGGEYYKCFERYEPKELARRRYIESITEGIEPSFGYAVLAKLIATNYINTVITTNFDDLAYNACADYASIHPSIYAYGIVTSRLRVTSQRPKILKLHGDYLYSALKNTSDELGLADPNMPRELMQVLSEYGLIVVGYGGNDISIMHLLERSLLGKSDLYWCELHGTELNENVKNLLREKGGFLVEIDGFDEMMDEIRHIVGLDVGNLADMDSVADKPNNKMARDMVFISYSRKDVRWLKMLKTHLKPFERQGVIKRWDDTEIRPGQIWKEEIEKAIRSAKVVVLLVSPEFLASDFISDNELPPLLSAAENEGATILSVVVKPCSFIQAGNISKYQAINSPDKTLAEMGLADRHKIFSVLTERILEVLKT